MLRERVPWHLVMDPEAGMGFTLEHGEAWPGLSDRLWAPWAAGPSLQQGMGKGRVLPESWVMVSGKRPEYV